ncbi:MAG: Spy/CpxP family protein refolding chaperone [Candidatus Azobacteroides sp.]|nr:Spy/CpxP family protein refolding chaperone [Candidatus Azobacteroides sp.]
MNKFAWFMIIACASMFLLSAGKVDAQNRVPFDAGNKRPFLNENIKSGELKRMEPDLWREITKNDIVSDLTPEQRSAIKDLITAKDKQLIQINNQLNEKKAYLRTLETSDNADLKSIDKTIDEIGALLVSQMKTEAECRQKIRSLLTEDQRIEFDLKSL